MDPLLTFIADSILGGKFGPVAVLIAIAIVLARAATKLEGHAKGLVDAIKQIGADLTTSREEDRAEHVRTRERIDGVKADVIAAVATDGGATRGELAALEERRWSDIEHALERSADQPPATPATGLPVVRRRTAGTGARAR